MNGWLLIACVSIIIFRVTMETIDYVLNGFFNFTGAYTGIQYSFIILPFIIISVVFDLLILSMVIVVALLLVNLAIICIKKIFSLARP